MPYRNRDGRHDWGSIAVLVVFWGFMALMLVGCAGSIWSFAEQQKWERHCRDIGGNPIQLAKGGSDVCYDQNGKVLEVW